MKEQNFPSGGIRVDPNAVESQIVGILNEAKMLNHLAATDEIMNSEDLFRLAQIQIGLERRSGQLEVKMAVESDPKALAAGRAEKRVTIALMDLARNRAKYLKDTTARLNHNFRVIAKEALSPEAYSHIEDRARLPLKK